jgi:transposase
MRQFTADDLIFLDESIFNEKTGWRHQAYAPIGHEARYDANVRRGRTWSICAAMTLDGWISCTGVKEGYFNSDDFFDWLSNQFLPAVNQKSQGRPMVIIMDNLSIHINQRVVDSIERAGHLVRFLPPYSPDFNPIELTFSVLKSWIRRHYYFVRQAYDNFGDFLRAAIVQSRCDRFARQQFRHAAGGIYIEQEELERLREQLAAYERGEVNIEFDTGVDMDENVLEQQEL